MIFLVIILGLIITVMPMAAPLPSIGIAAIAWPAIYLITYFLAAGFDMTQSLPWYVADPERATATLIIFVGVIGLLGGPLGSLAMLAVWVPLFLMPTWLLNLGVAIEHRQDWIGYVSDNYRSSCSTMNGRYVCTYTPKDGKMLPTFTQDVSIGSDRIMNVVPFNRGVSEALPMEALPDAVGKPSSNKMRCETKETVGKDGARTVTETCVSIN